MVCLARVMMIANFGSFNALIGCDTALCTRDLRDWNEMEERSGVDLKSNDAELVGVYVKVQIGHLAISCRAKVKTGAMRVYSVTACMVRALGVLGVRLRVGGGIISMETGGVLFFWLKIRCVVQTSVLY